MLAQDHRPIEVIVVSDGSTDGSVELAASYGAPVRVVEQPNLGPPAARNHGIRMARGEYLSFLDQDDLFRPQKLSKQLRALEDQPEIDLCLCTAQNFWEAGLEGEAERYVAAGRVRMVHHLSTLLTQRSVFDRVGPLDENVPVGDHVDWFLRARDLGLETFVLDEVLLDRRMHAGSFSHAAPNWDDFFAIAHSRIARNRH